MKEDNSNKEETTLLTREERAEMLKAIASPGVLGDKNRLAYIKSVAARVIPLIEAESYAGMYLMPDPKGAGEPADYPVGIRQSPPAWVSTGIGRTPIRQIEGDMLHVHQFYIDAAVEYEMKYAEAGHLFIADEAEADLGNQIVIKENLLFFTLLAIMVADASWDATQTIEVTGTGSGFLSTQLINNMLVKMEEMFRRPTDLLGSPRSIADVRVWSATTVDEITRREIFVQKGLAAIWDIALNTIQTIPGQTTLLDDATVWLLAKETLGVMPESVPFYTIEDPTAVAEWKVGIKGRKKFGMGVRDISSLVKGIITRT